MPKTYTFVPEKGVAYITSDLTVRAGAPLKKSDEVKVVGPGTALAYIGYVTDGEVVAGNATWYFTAEGDFFWSGNTTTKKPSVNAGTVDGRILSSPLKKLVCTQRFGERPEFYAPLGSPKGHNGMDFRTRKETDSSDWKQDVFSVLAGTVSEATENQFNGKYVRVAHDNGYESVYLHLSAIAVTAGQKVSAGQKVGISGNSGGASEAPHLHFGYRPIKYDKTNGYMGYVNPAPYFIDEVKYLS